MSVFGTLTGGVRTLGASLGRLPGVSSTLGTPLAPLATVEDVVLRQLAWDGANRGAN